MTIGLSSEASARFLRKATQPEVVGSPLIYRGVTGPVGLKITPFLKAAPASRRFPAKLKSDDYLRLLAAGGPIGTLDSMTNFCVDFPVLASIASTIAAP